LFTLEDSKIQVQLEASNSKKLSIKQGLDVKANQWEAEDTETFQLEYCEKIGSISSVAILAKNGKYLSASSKSLTATGFAIEKETKFNMEWHPGNKVAFKSNHNNKYVSTTSGGALAPTSQGNDSTTMFRFDLVNRPFLVLRCEHGYIGIPTAGSRVLCNKGVCDVLRLVSTGEHYKVTTSNGTGWRIDANGNLIADSKEGDKFIMEFRQGNSVIIRANNGKYLKGDHNGSVTATASSANCTQWEI